METLGHVLTSAGATQRRLLVGPSTDQMHVLHPFGSSTPEYDMSGREAYHTLAVLLDPDYWLKAFADISESRGQWMYHSR